MNFTEFAGWFSQIDVHLATFFHNYGIWAYALLFLIIFSETGFVFLPMLPGDTLLFASGALAASSGLNIAVLLVVIPAAAILGNTLNYFIGRYLASAVNRHKVGKLIKPENLQKAHRFFEKWGGWAITLCRFIAILRTVTPFVAGLGQMRFRSFSFYNAIGGIAWGVSLTLLGFFFGNAPFIRDNFHYLVLWILFLSTIPFLVAFLVSRIRNLRQKNRPAIVAGLGTAPVVGHISKKPDHGVE